MEDVATKPPRDRRALGGLLLLLSVHLGVAWGVGGRVGLQFDEVNFAVAALGVEDPGNFFVRHRTKVGPWTVPAAISSYRGAAKAWIYAPVLRALGRTPALVRLVPAVLFALAMAAVWLGLRRWAGGGGALAVVAVMLLHPEVLWSSIFDWGPVVLGILGVAVGTAALVAIHRMALEGRLLLAGALALVPGLAFGGAVFDKASNLWLVGCSGLALLAAAPRRWIAWRGLVLVPGLILGAVAACWPLIDYNLVVHRETGSHPTLAAAEGPGPGDLALTLRHALGGQGVFEFLRGERPFVAHPLLWLVAALPLAWLRLRGTGAGPRLRYALALAALLLLGMVRSPQPIGPHHTVFFVAALLLLCGVTIAGTWRTGRDLDRGIGLALLGLALVASLALSSWQGAVLVRQSGTGGWDLRHTAWLRDLPEPEGSYVVMDWGFTAPLALLHGRETRFQETYFAFDSRDPAKRDRLVTWMRNLAGDRRNLLLLHGARYTRTRGARDLMAGLLKEGRLDLELVDVVRDAEGEVLALAVRGAAKDTPPEDRLRGTLP